ncbi:MAG: ABC transporter ATP-binding protein [Treponema sp.]|nr:ABC transporter ATP-binding protein [Treponema sp.]
MNDVVLKITSLEKTFDSQNERLTLFKELSLSVARGESCVIAGQSGSGKSTLLNIIAGLEKATFGSVEVDGKDILKFDEDELSLWRKDTLGMVFQFHHLLKDFTAVENVFLPMYMAGVHKKEAMEKAAFLLEEVGLKERMSHLPSELSGGERQRVAVARSLANNPSLILADEPTGNLDPANSLLIGNLLFDMAKKHGKTLVLVTHDMNLAKKGDSLYLLENGSLCRKNMESL